MNRVRRWYHRYQQGSLSFPVVLVVWRTLWRRRSNLWVPPIYNPTGPGSPRLDSPKNHDWPVGQVQAEPWLLVIAE